jgi:Bacteriophage tail sheath protein
MGEDPPVAEEIHPGVFVDEVPSGSRTIAGVDTSTAAFVGAAELGPDEPVLVGSLAELESAYGSSSSLWAAARAFFETGGKRLYVQRAAADGYAEALAKLEPVDEIALVAAPGADAARELVEHAERMRYRFALLDAAEQGIDSSYAAVYRGEGLDAPASAHAAGIYSHAGQAAAEPGDADGPNVVRRGRDGRVELRGRRTLSSSPEWRYVNIRRLFIYLEHSIDDGTQWTVFEPNGEELWANVRRTIDDFLFTEWERGSLVGRKPEEAFFVRCDCSTMTQDDLDDGRLVCLVGVAPLRPAEFVNVRIGRWTADHRCR